MSLKGIALIQMIVLLLACQGEREGRNGKEEDHDNQKKTRIAEDLHGFWMDDHYLNKIAEDKSVYRNRKEIKAWFGFNLVQENLLGPNAKLFGITEHEGGYESDLRYNESLGRFEAGEGSDWISPFYIDRKGDHIRLVELNGTKSLLYRKVKDDNTALREILFAGKYQQLPDSSESVVMFGADGSLSGLGNHHYFKVVYDFVEGINYDAIHTYTNEGAVFSEGTTFKYEFSGDTLYLNWVNTDWDELNHQMTDSLIVLRKIHE